MATPAPASPDGNPTGFGAATLTLVGIGSVVGAGIFVITGQAAALYAGSGVVLSFALAAAVCLLSGLCYAELAALMPSSGSAYTFATAAFGRGVGWMIAWALVAEYLFATAAIAVGWSSYVQDLLLAGGIALPRYWRVGALAGQGLVNLPAVAIVLAVTASHLLGLRRSVRLNVALVLLKLSAVVLFIGFGLSHADPARWTPMLPPPESRPDGSVAYGWGGVLRAAGLVFFAYLGFEGLAAAGRETCRPRRDVPVALFATLGASALLYALAALAMTGLADYRTLAGDAPMVTALAAAGPALAWLRSYVGITVAIGLWTALWPAVFAMSRLLIALAEDGHLPPRVGALDSVRRTPRLALLVSGGAAAILAGLLPVALLAELISAGTLIAFTAVCAATLRLRHRDPRPRAFAVPWMPVVPVAGIAANLLLLAALGGGAALRILAWQGIGLLVLLILSRRRRQLTRA